MSFLSSIQRVALHALEAAVNRGLHLDPAALARMAALEGRMFEIHLRGPDLRLFLLPGGRGVQITDETDRVPDTTISGTPLALLRTGVGRGERPRLFSGDVEISGDVEAGRQLKSVLDEMDIDWEEQLSRLVGDVLAHQVGNVARGLRDWSRQSTQTLQEDIGEYLREESELLPGATEVDEFMAAVDRLRADTDRLEQRIRRLEDGLAAPSPDDSRTHPTPRHNEPEDGG